MRIRFSALTAALLVAGLAHAETQVLINQVGYDIAAPKNAIVQLTGESRVKPPVNFVLLDSETNQQVLSGTLQPQGEVQSWGDRTFYRADFSDWKKAGRYVLQTTSSDGDVRSGPFIIGADLLERYTLSDVIAYFKSQRVTGLFDKADRKLPLPAGTGSGTVDVHGGWYDATGDYGVHLSHQNLTSYFNPQQAPLVAWSLLRGYQHLGERHNQNFDEYRQRMLDEGLYGADFLVRMKRPGESFFQAISSPGKEKLAQDRVIANPNWRTQIKEKESDSTIVEEDAVGPLAWQASFRSGAGMSIAALALASTMENDGNFSRKQYLQTAEDAFAFLQKHNVQMVNDGKENIVDDYTALLAATELYRASHKADYLAAAQQRAQSLMARLTSLDNWHDYWRADAQQRPFFHPSDAGLPVIALLEYARIASPDQQTKIKDTVKRSLGFELAVTKETSNPFGYARQLIQLKNGEKRTSFFFPHDSEAAPWWQGENARVASLAAAARQAMPLFAEDKAFTLQLQNYAWDQLNWILGNNPYDVSMLTGSGYRHISYLFFNSWKYTTLPGGIVNGITGASNQVADGIAFDEGYAVTRKDDDWRWAEGWLPHSAWYLYAVSLPDRQ
ncbi:glycoside hydrolase family 9 protein [Candidatus Pantoea floridensis]|uniref:Beta-glucosidase family 9 n=1 Tax=Candidatus Pantoea floridensis TaxID=1938870 RepID=A0A286BW01_9GAMM|nr:glycoside hydrolase family 9 protein [Pantoea floridensis]PIF20811.1 beta-glucosidase (glycosyl hydrolase family 9) [Enterobacteriaceae bacterium JKS000233]SOD38327.1 beta-glucosidase family 9 [Pantoea floridensis]